jgi:hypothetical protein
LLGASVRDVLIYVIPSYKKKEEKEINPEGSVAVGDKAIIRLPPEERV